ncbi:hypothetical protein F5Y16DRAFT_265950 [Xylariaceae sp. FL0255]|nr:hypothetical protein F5Y16DRAFT_265950 [Xylariaceae sp. FL0255]
MFWKQHVTSNQLSGKSTYSYYQQANDSLYAYLSPPPNNKPSKPTATILSTTTASKMSSGEQIVRITAQDIRKMQPMPMTFLTLAPETSASYPTAQKTTPATTRRSSSVSSAGGPRVLKLGPVHWGEHPDEHKEDFHEIAVE